MRELARRLDRGIDSRAARRCPSHRVELDLLEPMIPSKITSRRCGASIASAWTLVLQFDFGGMIHASNHRPNAMFQTHASLRNDLLKLGIVQGDTVMVHAAMSRVGRLLHGPDALIAALRDTVGPSGTVVAYTDWDGAYDDLLDDKGRVPPAWRAEIPGFDPRTSRAIRDNGVLAEFVRTTPGARRSENPGASVAAIGQRAEWLTQDHPMNYGYGEGSPFAKLIEAGGKVLMVGAPLDTMTLLHHAEHLARIPGKRVKRYDVPLARPQGVEWYFVEEFDTTDPVVAGLESDYFCQVVRAYLASGCGTQGSVGEAPSTLVEAAGICAFGVRWLEQRTANR